jgi:hypothetical protein
VSLTGPQAGFVIDGQHDVEVVNIRVDGSIDLPAIDVRNSSAITIGPGGYAVFQESTAPAIRLAGVTDSVVTGSQVNRGPAGGIVLDAATSGVVVKGGLVRGAGPADSGDESVGIRVAGSGNSILNLGVIGYGGAAIAIEPGARDNVVANNQIDDGGGVEIGVYDGGVGTTVVDYNNVYRSIGPSPDLYGWDGTRMSLAAFRATSGQAAHDLETESTGHVRDSGNSAAPGFQAVDRFGHARVDLPNVFNTGAGPIAYADRGTSELGSSPQLVARINIDVRWHTVQVDLSGSLPGSAPITSYSFDFGAGAGTTTSPLATHRYDEPGDYALTMKVTAADNRVTTRTEGISIRPTVGDSFGLLSLFNLQYVTAQSDGVLAPNSPALPPGHFFDLVDAGSGRVALLDKQTWKYASVQPGTSAIAATSTWIGPAERFTRTRNTDGSIALQSEQNGRYVSIVSQTSQILGATRTAVNTWEKFHPVTVGPVTAARSLKAVVNGKFVSADSAGTKPLIASRDYAQLWEQFDIIDLGDGQVALFARVNNRFVAAEDGGTQPLQAKRLAVSTWERFTMVHNSDGTVSFRSATNNLYVSAEGAGTKPLIASRPAINTWEKFTLF